MRFVPKASVQVSMPSLLLLVFPRITLQADVDADLALRDGNWTNRRKPARHATPGHERFVGSRNSDQTSEDPANELWLLVREHDGIRCPSVRSIVRRRSPRPRTACYGQQSDGSQDQTPLPLHGPLLICCSVWFINVILNPETSELDRSVVACLQTLAARRKRRLHKVPWWGLVRDNFPPDIRQGNARPCDSLRPPGTPRFRPN